MKMILFRSFLATVILGQSLSVLANINDQAGMSAASEVAEEMADDLVSHLYKGKASVIFVDLSQCTTYIPWCQSFMGRLQSDLSQKKIRFLSDENSVQIRNKIAEEQIYQSSSQMVDVKKAVEIGKQDAFHAFVSVSITGDEPMGFVNIHIQSIDIKSASVSVSLFKTVRINRSMEKSWSRIFTGTLTMGLGLATVYRSYELGLHHKEQADLAFDQYQLANSAVASKEWKQKAQDHDKKVKICRDGEIVGWSLAGIALLILITGSEERISYDIVSNQKQDPNHWLKPKASPYFSPSELGFQLAWSL